MWKVCVADDEKYVLKSIIQRIEISGMPFEIAGVAGDGREAHSHRRVVCCRY